MQESKQFKVGDRVAYVGKYFTFKGGRQPVGVLVRDDNSSVPYLVDFDEKIFDENGCMGHDGSGRCKKGHGQWVHVDDLILTKEDKEALFKVGDRVECVVDYSCLPKGSKGTVLIIDSDGSIGVEWDDFDGGHDFYDRVDGCKAGHGWWLNANKLKLINEEHSSLHYETTVQPIEFMQANMTHEEFIGFLKGNIIKYTARCGKKDDVDKEVAKIIEYAKWLAKAYKGETIDPRESY